MNAFHLVEKDQSKASWTAFELVKALPKRPRQPELPAVIYTFFGPPSDGEMRMKPQYEGLRCKVCGQFDDDEIFRVGFFDPVIIKIKGDFSHTEDKVFAISGKFLGALKKGKVRGYEVKPLGSTGWHAMRITERVECKDNVMEEIGPFCPE